MTITAVQGAAKRAGVRAGESLVSVNGHAVNDVLDYRFYSYDNPLTLELRSECADTRLVTLRHREGDDPGLSFDSYLMDKERHCQNACVFCFIDQNPKGCRESLYFKDDDARLSFLLGNYITLTNLDEDEIERICRFRVSPLGISIHATEPEVRFAMLRNPKARNGFEIMKRFADAGIRQNAQIVLCPGYNDGDTLSRTLRDLESLGDSLISVSVVPVGLTKHREALPRLTAVTQQAAGDAIRRTAPFEKVFCSDELYLRADLPLPPAAFYGDYPQLENGVGMMALFADEWAGLPPLPRGLPPQSLATGMAARPFFEKLLQGTNIRVIGAENRFFGPSVDVAGLLSGGDLLHSLRGQETGTRILIPDTMLRHGTDCFLDDMTLPELSSVLSVPVAAVTPSADALWDAIARE